MERERKCENCYWRLKGVCNNDRCQNCEEFEPHRSMKCRIKIDDTIDNFSTPCADYKPMDPCDYHRFEGEHQATEGTRTKQDIHYNIIKSLSEGFGDALMVYGMENRMSFQVSQDKKCFVIHPGPGAKIVIDDAETDASHQGGKLVSSNFKTITDQIINFGRNESTFWGCALAGEAGEVCNIIKKMARDGDDTKDKEGKRYMDLLPAQLADVFIYLVLTARHFNIDLEEAILSKIEIVNKRPRGGA